MRYQTTTVVRHEQAEAVPWRNGAGMTREIAIRPSLRGMGFDWRLSLADIARDCPFSVYPGVDRTFMVLSAGQVELTIDGCTRLAERLTPFAFPGESTVAAHLAGSPTVNVNLMTRRDACVGRMRVGTIGERKGAELVAVMPLSGQARTIGGAVAEPGETLLLGVEDVLIADDAVSVVEVAVRRTGVE